MLAAGIFFCFFHLNLLAIQIRRINYKDTARVIQLWDQELAFKTSRKPENNANAQAPAAKMLISPARTNVTDCFMCKMNAHF